MRLYVLCERDRAYAFGRAASNAAEDRNIGSVDNGVADGLLGRERVNSKYCVGVTVSDDGDVGREHKGLDPAAVHDDAAGCVALLRHLEDVPELAVHIRRFFDFVHIRNLHQDAVFNETGRPSGRPVP